MRNIKRKLLDIDRKYQGKNTILGKNTLIPMMNRMNSSRGLLISGQLDQITVLEKTEPPRFYTNFEKIVGKYSAAYYQAENDCVVVRRINKFPNNPDAIYTLIIYDKKDKAYNVITKKPGERLTETYGYKYNTDIIDNLKEGYEINSGDVLYRSTSFNEDMLYSFGINIPTYYTTDPGTIEDAIIIDTYLQDKLNSIEYDSVKFSLNGNDIMINYYGDNENYKSFPDIGEKIKDGILGVRRRITYSQSLFDLKEENMKKILSTDDPLYVPFGDDTVVDIDIYCNKPIDEIKDTVYNRQILNYLQNQTEYYQAIKNALEEYVTNDDIKAKDDLYELYSRCRRILDPEIKWKENDGSVHGKVFDNMIVEIQVEKRIGAVIGQKLCGRYGDKGVISEIRKVEDMPILETGERIHMLCAIVGVGGRYEICLIY